MPYMFKAFTNFLSIPKPDDELEDPYGKLFIQAIHRCGNVHKDNDNKTLYIYGLSKTIQTILVCHLEAVHCREVTIDEVAHSTSSEDESVSTRALQARQYSRPPTTWTLPLDLQPSKVPGPLSLPNHQCSVRFFDDVQSHSSDDISIVQFVNYNDGCPQQSNVKEDDSVVYVDNKG